MSETITPRLARHPAQGLIDLLITLLTPMFLAVAGGDLAIARLAAAQALESYRAETHADLITIAKIVAFGLTTLASLSLSMADDLPAPMILRLRNSANATDRAEHRNRLVLGKTTSHHPVPPAEADPEIDTAALTAAAADMQRRTAENLARFAPPAPTPANTATPAPAVTDAEQYYQATWAASAAAIAAETAASLPSLSPQERYSAAIWIDALNDAAKSFMAGDIPPRPRPGDLAAVMRGT